MLYRAVARFLDFGMQWRSNWKAAAVCEVLAKLLVIGAVDLLLPFHNGDDGCEQL